MTTEKKNRSLSEYVRERRESQNLDYNEAARLSGLDHTFWRKLEGGHYEAPSPKSLEAIAKTLDVPIEDLYALAGYELSADLPSFRPYLRARYQLPHQAVAELERYFELLRNYYGIAHDQSVFPPKPPAKTPSKQPRSAKAKRRAA